MESKPLVVMWRRLDQPGHEVMRFSEGSNGAVIEGWVAYREDQGPIGLRYRVEIRPDWTTTGAKIEGQVQGRDLQHRIERDRRGWLLDGEHQPGLDDIPHLDFGFTPATNMPQLRHAALGEGGSTAFDVAWFDVGRAALERLDQRYHRIDQERFDYESPATGYAAQLRLAADGFTVDYPDLWERVAG